MLTLWSTYLTGIFLENARIADANDSKDLERLAIGAEQELIQKRGGSTLSKENPDYGDAESYFKSAFSDSSVEVFVGTIDDVIVGFGVIKLGHLEDGTAHASIKALYVEEAARSIGVGEVMMEEMLVCATSHKAEAVDAVALPGDRATKNFFETHGLVARAIIVQKALTEQAK